MPAGKRKRARTASRGARHERAPEQRQGESRGRDRRGGDAAGLWPAVVRWAFVALIAVPVAWLLGIVELEPASLLQFLAVIAAIGFVFEYLQPRLGGSGENR